MDGQITLFDIFPQIRPKNIELLPCDNCEYEIKGCCSYNTKYDFCVLGNKQRKKKEVE